MLLFVEPLVTGAACPVRGPITVEDFAWITMEGSYGFFDQPWCLIDMDGELIRDPQPRTCPVKTPPKARQQYFGFMAPVVTFSTREAAIKGRARLFRQFEKELQPKLKGLSR